MSEQRADILLVEDNPSDLELTLRTLRRNRIAGQIDVARDGAEALDYLLGAEPGAAEPDGVEHQPKLILLDLKLPKVDGLDVLRRVKAHPRTRRIPIVVLTSSREERDIVESYEFGVNSYIVKPVDFEEFVDAVRQVGLYWLLLNQADL